ncbi:MAG: hypothetical protein M9894_25800 [Planctomycetes bacterium]|nr:hypothetical protein [Planctomycetota bacterium]
MRPGHYLIGSVLVALGCAAADHPDPDAPARGELVVAPRLDPPPARRGALEREDVLALARSHADPADAIAALDVRRFGFPLDDDALDWFGQQGVDPAVMDYLVKRARVDWDALRGDVDPDGPY